MRKMTLGRTNYEVTQNLGYGALRGARHEPGRRPHAQDLTENRADQILNWVAGQWTTGR